MRLSWNEVRTSVKRKRRSLRRKLSTEVKVKK